MSKNAIARPSFFMLRAGELKVTLDCGCVLVNEVNAVFRYCPLHYAAPDLLAALEESTTALRTTARLLEGASEHNVKVESLDAVARRNQDAITAAKEA